MVTTFERLEDDYEAIFLFWIGGNAGADNWFDFLRNLFKS